MTELKKKTSNVLVYLGLWVAVFVLGIMAVVALRLMFERATDGLSDLAANEKVRLAIGNHIASEINDMESLFFQLAPVSGLYDLNIYAERIHKLIGHINGDVRILEQGGVFESRTLLNTPMADVMRTRLSYKPDANEHYILAAIELKPQLYEIEKRMNSLVKLLEERARLRRQEDSEGYFKLVRVIQLNLRRAIPLFHRLKETANNIIFESVSKLEDVETVIAAKKRQYRMIEAAMYAGLVLLFGLFSTLISFKIKQVIKKEKESDAELKKAGEFLNTILESLKHPFRVVDLKSKEIEISNAAAKTDSLLTCQMKCEDSLTNSELWCSANNCSSVLEEVKKSGKSLKFVETTRQDGSRRFLEYRAFPVIDEIGSIKKLIEYWMDVTDQKLAEQEKMILAAVIEQSDASVLIADSSGQIYYVNPAFESSYGYTKNESLGKDLLEVAISEKDERFRQEIWNSLKSGSSWKGTLIARTKDGNFRDEAVVFSAILDNKGLITNYVATKRDISVEVELEKQFRHAQKMEAVGTLAGGIAHDFNNLLQIVLGYSDMMLNSADPESPGFRKLVAIRKAATNGTQLVGELLAFSRKSPVSAESIDLNVELKRMSDLLVRTIPKMIEIKLNLEPELHIVKVDSTQFEQIILNLATNARDAMPNGGVLLLQTKNVELGEDFFVKNSELKPGPYVLVTVSDNGSGIAPDVANHIFEPFFSTKEVGKGTGLGLSTVFGIVQAHGGHIACETQLGVGTTFNIYFPTTRVSTDMRQPVESNIYHKGSETILIVEDDTQLRDMLIELMESMGYETIMASTGKEGLELYKKYHGKIALVILDLIMPQMDGKKCLEELLQFDPNVKVLIASGYSGAQSLEESLSLGAKAFINKPYDVNRLLKAVRNVLDGVC